MLYTEIIMFLMLYNRYKINPDFLKEAWGIYSFKEYFVETCVISYLLGKYSIIYAKTS